MKVPVHQRSFEKGDVCHSGETEPEIPIEGYSEVKGPIRIRPGVFISPPSVNRALRKQDMTAERHSEELAFAEAVQVAFSCRLGEVDPGRDVGFSDFSAIRVDVDHVAIDGVDLGMGRECGNHVAEIGGLPPVVAVELSDHIGSGVGCGDIAGLLGSAVLCAHDASMDVSFSDEAFGD